MAAKNNSYEIEINRIYDAPVKLVWDAWTDPKQVAQWWGPRGFTITHHDKDLRPGGIWKYTMHGPDGKDWPNTTHYLEVVQYSRLVYDHGGSESTPPLFRVEVNFKEVKGKTHMDMKMIVESPEKLAHIRNTIKQASGNSTWDRLGEYLAKEVEHKEKFFINRSFDAPIEVLYQMWSDPKHFSKWLAPTGFDMEFIREEVKPGGTSFYKMTNHKDVTMYGKVHYIEFRKPDLLMYTQQFADEKGGVARHPMAPTWPETMLTVVQFTSEGPNKTRVTIAWEPHGKVTAEELATFIQARSGMTMGWTGSLDKLEEYLAK